MLMIGYGSYGVSVPAHYRPEIAHLLQLGWSIAYAHVRGGGEYGPNWYEAGRCNKKWNTFLDFVACANYLINNGTS
jgi:oligopeptidase B